MERCLSLSFYFDLVFVCLEVEWLCSEYLAFYQDQGTYLIHYPHSFTFHLGSFIMRIAEGEKVLIFSNPSDSLPGSLPISKRVRSFAKAPAIYPRPAI